MSYYFDYTIEIIDINFRDILLDEKRYKNILIYDISYKTAFMGSIPLHNRFDEIDGFIKIYDGIRYLVLFSYLFHEISNRTEYLKSEKSGITDSINYNFAKIRIVSCNSSPFENILTFHSVMILIKSVVNENKNKYYYNIFLEKGSYQDKSNTIYFLMIFVYQKYYILIG